MDEQLRLRLLVVLASGLLAWLVWTESQSAAHRLAVARQAQTQSTRENTQAARERERRDRLHRVAGRLAERPTPPTSAAAVREFLVGEADRRGVELSQLRLQPLVRPPEGTLGAEAGVTLLGDPVSLSALLAAVEGHGWPLRTERATLAVRGGVGTLSAGLVILWPDPAASFTAAEAAALADDPRLDGLATWLEGVPGPQATAPVAAAEPVEMKPAPPVEPGVQESGEAPPEAAPPSPPPSETPELHGFVDVGSGTPVRAALFYRGETTLVGVGDRVGDYTVVTLEPSEAVVLSRGEGPPLRLILR